MNPAYIEQKDLVTRFNSHANLQTAADAVRMRTGVLDIALLDLAGLHVPDALRNCSVVDIRYAAQTRNCFIQRDDFVFNVLTPTGEFCSSYFSTAFKMLAF